MLILSIVLHLRINFDELWILFFQSPQMNKQTAQYIARPTAVRFAVLQHQAHTAVGYRNIRFVSDYIGNCVCRHIYGGGHRGAHDARLLAARIIRMARDRKAGQDAVAGIKNSFSHGT